MVASEDYDGVRVLPASDSAPSAFSHLISYQPSLPPPPPLSGGGGGGRVGGGRDGGGGGRKGGRSR